jgi:hypothetical protein
MVRKWPYLVSKFLYANPGHFETKSSVYTFKVFRMTTRFKKFNRKSPTVMVRKKYARRKHRTNWLRLSYITKNWVFLYIRSKQFVRFYQSLGLFNTQSYSTSVLVFEKKLSEVVNYAGLTTFACSRSIISLFLSKGDNTKYYNTPLLGSLSSGLATRDITNLPLSESINPGLVDYDSLLYPYTTVPSTRTEDLELYNSLLEVNFSSTLNYVTASYHTLVLLTLFNLFKQ